MQQPEELWKSFPLDPAPSAAPAARQGEPSPTTLIDATTAVTEVRVETIA